MATRKPTRSINEEGVQASVPYKSDQASINITMGVVALIIMPFYFTYQAIKSLWNNL